MPGPTNTTIKTISIPPPLLKAVHAWAKEVGVEKPDNVSLLARLAFANLITRKTIPRIPAELDATRQGAPNK